MPDITKVNIRDINPLEHITSDIAKTRTNYESILNGIVTWSTTDNPNVTVRLSTDNYPYFVDYTFPSRKSQLESGSGFGTPELHGGLYDYDHILDITAAKGDNVTLRLSVDEGSGLSGEWRMFALPTIYRESGTTATRNYVSGSFIWLEYLDSNTGDIVRKMLVATIDIASGTTFGYANTMPAVVKWNVDDYESYDIAQGLATYTCGYVPAPGTPNSCYVLDGKSTESSPSSVYSSWINVALGNKTCHTDYIYDRGSMYLYYENDDKSDAAMYMYIGETRPTPGPDGVKPYKDSGVFDSENWYGPLMLIPVARFERSTVLHHVAPTDIDGYILRSESNEVRGVSVLANVALPGASAEPHKGLKIFDTSNYVMWPDNTQRIWNDGVDYSGSTEYAAKMLFHHASDEVKSCNVVNYDGPDLDRGLAIYLPATDVVVSDNGAETLVEAKDGATIEFMFRIWPTTSYNGASTPDLIINKAQIYVYTVDRSDELASARVVAKFSMARLTNFYLWAENVAVPNRPVFYKAKFVYSVQDGEWKTYDYYQIPDHVFLSPKGFVDPSIRNSSDGDAYGEEGAYSGVQTAGFPLMQDPFGGLDLGPIRMNRIEPNS